MENCKKEDIVIFAAVEPDIIAGLEEFAKSHGKQVVQLDDKVISDYLKGGEKAYEPSRSLEEFLGSEKNRTEAEIKAIFLFNLITHNGDMLTAKDRVFKKSEVVRATNLTHKTLGELLTFLSLFGFIEYKRGNYEFSFVFSKDVQRASALTDITSSVAMTNRNIARYLSLFPKEEREGKLKEVFSGIAQISNSYSYVCS